MSDSYPSSEVFPLVFKPFDGAQQPSDVPRYLSPEERKKIQEQEEEAARQARYDEGAKAGFDKGKKEGYDEGYKQGLEEGQVKGQTELFAVEQDLATALKSLDQKVTDMLKEHATHVAQVREDMLFLTRAMLEKLYLTTLENFPESQVIEAIDTIVSRLYGRTALTIAIHPSIEEVLKEKRGELLNQESITLKTNPDLEPFNCVISWLDGGMKTKREALWQEVESQLSAIMKTVGSGESTAEMKPLEEDEGSE